PEPIRHRHPELQGAAGGVHAGELPGPVHPPLRDPDIRSRGAEPAKRPAQWAAAWPILVKTANAARIMVGDDETSPKMTCAAPASFTHPHPHPPDDLRCALPALHTPTPKHPDPSILARIRWDQKSL